MDISKIGENVSVTLKKHSPEILSGIGMAGMVTSTIFAVKATPKALILIEEEKRRQNAELFEIAQKEGHTDITRVDKLKPMEIVKTAWRCYIPAASIGIISLACLIGASSVHIRRNAVLAAAYTISESTLKDYRSKVIEELGEKKDVDIRQAVAQDKLKKQPVENTEVIITQSGDDLCYDAFSGRYFKSSVTRLEQAANEVNSNLYSFNYVSLNTFYDLIGLDSVKIGDQLGWSIDQGMLKLDLYTQLASNDSPCVVLDFETAPVYDFDRLL